MSEAKPLLFVLGASHRTAPTALREHFFLSEEQLSSLLPQIKEKFGFAEIAVLSTCNRFELIGSLNDHGDSATKVYQAFLDLQRRDHSTLQPSEEEIRNVLYLHLGHEAVSHVFRVASSLDSLILGETQITGQFKAALVLAQKSQTSGPLVSRLGQEALGLAKKIRTNTDIGKKHVSISHAAIELAQKVFGHLGDHRFLVIGAGEMSEVAAKYIKSYQPKGLAIANRTVAKAKQIVNDLGIGEAYGLEDLFDLIKQSDVVISSTAAPGFMLEYDLVSRAQASRKGRPLVLLDIALPRDIDPAAASIDDVYLFDIDDLKQVVGANLEERRKAAQQAEEFVIRSVEQFEAWLKTMSIKPILSQFRVYLDQTISRELERTLGKEIFRSSPKHTEGLKGLCQAITARIAADAAKSLTTPYDNFSPETLAAALGTLFTPAPVPDPGNEQQKQSETQESTP